ncbi:MAG: PAS domain S-box protein, partial [Armatimonadetes bacterium]|nr:PAS domain S-box protein [Armatimonadota bacterium]
HAAELLSALLGPLVVAIESGDRGELQQQLEHLATEACQQGVPYQRISRGLRILKRQLMRLTVHRLPAGHDRDLVCDLIEEEIDESRVVVNQAYHTLHEQQLRDSEAITRFLLNNTLDAIFLLDAATGRIEMANAMAVEVTGQTLDDLSQRAFVELLPESHVGEFEEALRRVAIAHTLRLEGLPLLTEQGAVLATTTQLTLVPRDSGRRLVQATVRDTSEATAAQLAREQETAYLRSFISGTADAVILLTADGRVQSWNQGATEIFGYQIGEMINKRERVLLPPELVEAGELERLDQVVNEQGYVRGFESQRVTKDGRRLDVEITRTAFFEPGTGQRLGTSVVVRDVSEKRRLEREMQRKSRQLEIMNRIIEATSRSLDRDQTLRTIATQIEGLLPCDALVVCVPEAEMTRVRCRVLIGSGDLVTGSEYVVERDDAAHAPIFSSQGAVLIDDLAELPRPGHHDQELLNQGFRAVLTSPMVFNNETLGTLLLLHRTAGTYDEEDRWQLDHLANHFAVTLENARRYEEERKRAAQFELISRVGAAAIANIGDVKRLMRSVVDTIQTDFGYYDVAIYEVDEDAGAFRLRAQAGHRRGALGDGFQQGTEVGVFGEVLRSQTSYVCNNTQEDALYFDPTPGDHLVRSELCVPIRLGPRVYGVLDVESQRADRFDRLDRAAMEALASLLARCMEADESLRHTRMLQAMRHNIMEAVPSALILLDDDLRVRFVNRRYCEFFGQSVEEIMHRHAGEVFPPKLLEESRFFELVEQLKESRRPIDQREVRYQDFGGVERYSDVRLRIVTEYETNIIVMLHDATMRLKRLYQLSMLQEIGEEMQRTLDTDRLLQAILTCVTAGPGFGFNRAALFLVDRARCQLTERLWVGPETPEQAGEVWHQLGHKKTLREFLREYDRERAEGRVVSQALHHEPLVVDLGDEQEFLSQWRAPLMMRSDDGEEQLQVARSLRSYSGAHEVLVVPLVSQETVIGLIVADNLFSGEPISRDSIRMLTTFASQAGVALANAQAFEQLRQSLEELRRAQDDLRQAERLAGIGSVAANVAHEIRNPLVSIGGFARRLQDKAADSEYVASRAAIIVKEVQRLEQILKNVADFTAPGAPELAPTQLSDLVHEVLGTQSPVLEESRTELVVRTNHELPAVLCDADKIKQVILNLVRNAIQAMGPGGRLEVGTCASLDGDGVDIWVADSGPGIPSDRLEEIFNPFFTNKADGTGLGLAVSRKIAVDHGGTLSVDSREGEGATFILSLPLSGRPEIVRSEREERGDGTAHPDR